MIKLPHSMVIALAASALTLAATAQPVAKFATPAPLVQEPQQPQQPQQMPQADPSQATTFSGTIVKSGSSYVLRDSSGSTYQLDDSAKAKQFEGKQVKVVGRLDAGSHTIHVDSIEGGS